jgi:hypothetical protein
MCGEHIQELYSVFDPEPTKLLCHPKQKPRGEGPQTDKHLPPSLYKSIFKKSRRLGLESNSYRYLVHGAKADDFKEARYSSLNSCAL